MFLYTLPDPVLFDFMFDGDPWISAFFESLMTLPSPLSADSLSLVGEGDGDFNLMLWEAVLSCTGF